MFACARSGPHTPFRRTEPCTKRRTCMKSMSKAVSSSIIWSASALFIRAFFASTTRSNGTPGVTPSTAYARSVVMVGMASWSPPVARGGMGTRARLAGRGSSGAGATRPPSIARHRWCAIVRAAAIRWGSATGSAALLPVPLIRPYSGLAPCCAVRSCSSHRHHSEAEALCVGAGLTRRQRTAALWNRAQRSKLGANGTPSSPSGRCRVKLHKHVVGMHESPGPRSPSQAPEGRSAQSTRVVQKGGGRGHPSSSSKPKESARSAHGQPRTPRRHRTWPPMGRGPPIGVAPRRAWMNSAGEQKTRECGVCVASMGRVPRGANPAQLLS